MMRSTGLPASLDNGLQENGLQENGLQENGLQENPATKNRRLFPNHLL